MNIDFTLKEISYLKAMIECNYDDETQPKEEKRIQDSVLRKLNK